MAINLLDADTRIEVLDSELPNVNDGDPDVVYVLRQVTPAAQRSLQKRVPNKRTGQMDIDVALTVDAVLDYALVEWRGVLFDGTPAPCDHTNRMLLDFGRRQALALAASTNRQTTVEQKEASFREPARVG